MKRSLAITLTIIFILFLVTECDQPQSPDPEPQEFGYLSLNVGLQIEELPAGRIEAVSPDDFIVTIYNADDGTIAEQWASYLEVPEQVQLPTGTYYVTATNLAEPEDAAFERPWYYGESEVFTIDKEELETIEVECTLANCKISFSYTQNVVDNFTNWDATATIDDGSSNPAFLEWIGSDPAEGYFLIDNPIDIEVYLEYEKAFEPDELITRTFTHTISDPAPATHYLVNIDASLEDGKIMINITVDDDFDTVEISLGDGGGDDGQELVTDIDGNEYSIVQIGDQLWMAENLAVTKFNDGTPIPNVTDDQIWSTLTTPAYSWYNNSESGYKEPYGAYYNWYTVGTGTLCPSGWHVPSDAEWTALTNYLGGENIAGGKLKEEGTVHWDSPNSGATNEAGFSAIPGGDRHLGSFVSIGVAAFLWSNSENSETHAWYRGMYYNGNHVLRNNFTKQNGFSVRCLQD